MRAPLFMLCCAFFIPVVTATTFVFPNALGRYGVGFKVIQQYDETRPYHDAYDIVNGQTTVNRAKHARPIQTLVWYPAEKSGADMTYGDYLALAASQDRFDNSPAEVAQMTAAAMRLDLGYLKNNHAQRIDQIKDAPVHAMKGAAPVGGTFPVIVYAPSDGGRLSSKAISASTSPARATS
jgi:hypothetical protein